MQERSSFLVALATLVLGLLGVERALAWYGPRHFVPELRLEQALGSPSQCVVLVGDSRMVAGYDEAALVQGLKTHGRDACVKTIAIGALRIPGLAIAVREYLERGGKPSLVVLGASEDTLLAREEPFDPGTFVGNEAALLSWSHRDDVRRLYPEFPFGSPLAFDQGFRFLVARSSAFGTYLSLAWQKVQAFQDRVTGRAQASNVFGALSDMEARGRAMQRVARAELALALERPESERLDPWFAYLEENVHAAGASLLIVELPMPSSYRRTITQSLEGQRYLDWLESRMARRGDRLVDLATPEWLDPADFADFVHLNQAGARRFSTELGIRLANTLNGKAPEPRLRSPMMTR